MLALVVAHAVASPVTIIKVRIGKNEICLKVEVTVVAEGVGVGDLCVDPAYGRTSGM